MIGVVADKHFDSQLLEIVCRTRIRIAPCDAHSSPRKKLGERAHPRTGDAHEVHRARIRFIER
jgi:hypothetical protein